MILVMSCDMTQVAELIAQRAVASAQGVWYPCPKQTCSTHTLVHTPTPGVQNYCWIGTFTSELNSKHNECESWKYDQQKPPKKI
eukprot:3817091-Amphidinium_carterae.1